MLVIPLFIPHQGCPQHCLFCNQATISGEESQAVDNVSLIQKTVTEWLDFSRKHSEVQAAFYGGSFTCLPIKRQELLLNAIQPFISSGKVGSIRLSTRPDCVDEQICDFLLSKGVKTVELGVQSLDDSVLAASHRGHSSEDSLRAASLLKKKGLELGVQLMPGLPKETTTSFLKTVDAVIEMQPDFVRLYPTLVICKSGLADHYNRGVYQPMSMNRAVALCCRAKERLEKAGIRILRIGLQASTTLEDELIAGPYHPAFGEFVTARHWFRRVRSILADCPSKSRVQMHISSRDHSAFVGHKRSNIIRFKQLGLADSFDLKTDSTLQRGTLEYVINH